MESFFALIFFLLLPWPIGILTIVLSIDLFEYLKKYHPATYKQMSYENLFGMSGDRSLFFSIKPQEYFRFLLAPADMKDQNTKTYKTRIKLSLSALLGLVAIYVLWSIIF